MIHFSYLHQPGHHRNPKNPLTLQTWTLQWEQRKNAHLIMVQCCYQYHFTFFFCESLILQISDFLYFVGRNYFLGLVNLVLQGGIYLLTTAFNHSFITWVTNIGKSTCESIVGKICSQVKPKFLFCLLWKMRVKKQGKFHKAAIIKGYHLLDSYQIFIIDLE